MQNNFIRQLPAAFSLLVFCCFSSLQLSAQCPGTTYSVGSGVGIPNLSGAPLGVANMVAGESVLITGTFTIDIGPWNITSANVYFANTASEVTINSNQLLNASSTVFQACAPTYQWSTIRVLQNATITANSCTFKNGANAIYIVSGATFNLTGNLFDDNTNCLRIAGQQNPANHTILNNAFNNSTLGIVISGRDVTIGNNNYNSDYAGVQVVGGQNIFIAGGIMINMHRGLEITPVAGAQCIEMTKVIFSGNTAVYSEQARYNLHIFNCTLRATQTAIDIKNHLTSVVSSGTSCSGGITIQRNTISSLTETGVRIASTYGLGTIDVSGNIISSEIASTTPFTYYGIEIVSAFQPHVLVDANEILNQGGGSLTTPGGIYLNNCRKTSIISNNIIKAGVFGGVGDLQFGITTVKSPHSLVYNNNVDGGPNITDRAISIENPMDDIDLCCNIMTNSGRGLNMMGPHENCQIQTSIFNGHNEALYYDMVVSSNAPQFHKGNNWSAANTTWDAYFNGNAFFAFTCKYQVDPSLLPNGLTKIFVTGGVPSDWFSTPSSSELDCNAACGDGFSGEGGEGELSGNDYWAMAPLADPDYAALHWEAQKFLYGKLEEYPGLLEDAQAAAFYSTAQNSNVGKFYSIETGVANLYHPDATSDPAQKIADLQVLNAGITPNGDYQLNEQQINSIYLAALAQNDWDFSAGEKTILDEIAALCPQFGGNAVYTARLLQENYRVPYWNMNACLVEERSNSKSSTGNGFSLFPSPASDQLMIRLSQGDSPESHLEIFDLTGRLVLQQKVPANTPLFSIQTDRLPNGSYLLRITGNSHQIGQQKFIVAH